ncbi:MAG: cyclic pyranopterin monophosphate synthase MoaC [Mariniblastus sp.]
MSELSHFDSRGQAHMVDVGEKPTTRRVAVAKGKVQMEPATLQLIQDLKVAKGNVLELARIAAVMASKKTSDVIPLCHPLRLDSVEIDFETLDEQSLEITATVSATERTGVEMEALHCVSVAGLVIYDMCKSVDRSMQLTDIRLEEKTGGKSGHFKRT